MVQAICDNCKLGMHEKHTPVIQAAPEGMMGGTGCRCRGECVDGRYAYVIPPEVAGLADELRKKGW